MHVFSGFALEGFQTDGNEFSLFEDKEFVSVLQDTLVSANGRSLFVS